MNGIKYKVNINKLTLTLDAVKANINEGDRYIWILRIIKHK